MKKNYLKNLVLFTLLAMAFPGLSQSFSWFNSAGTDGSAVYSDGTNVYRVGYFNNTTTVGPSTLTSNGNYDILISKSDINGNVVWAKKYGGINEERGSGLCVDLNGNIYITGYFTGTVTTIGSNTFTNNASWSEDAYVAKLDPSGNMLWSMQISNDTYVRGLSVSCDATGNDVYLLGTFQNSIAIGTSTFTQQGFLSNNYIVKLTSSGSVVWEKNYGSGEGKKLKMDATGNGYFLCNYFGNTIVGTNTLSSGGSLIPGSFVANFDASGNIISSVNYKRCLLNDFCLDGLSNIWTTGKMNSSSTQGTFSLSTNGNDDILVVKASSTGSITFAQNYGATPSEYGSAICADAANNIFVVGNKANTNSFGTLSTPGAAFFVKLNNGGTEQWLTSIPGTVLGDVTNNICSDNSGNIFATGVFYASQSQPVTVNSTTYTQGGGFLTKLNPAGLPSGLKEFGNENRVTLYPNPTSGVINFDLKQSVSEIKDIKIYNVQMQQQKISAQNINSLNVENLPSGIYFIEIVTVNGIYKNRFVKQ